MNVLQACSLLLICFSSVKGQRQTSTVTVLETLTSYRTIIALGGSREINTVLLDNGNGETFTEIINSFSASRIFTVTKASDNDIPIVTLTMSPETAVAKAMNIESHEMSPQEFDRWIEDQNHH